MTNKTLPKPQASLRSWLQITPELAGKLLGANSKNYRNLSKAKVEKYARDMRNGKWNEYTRESLKFTGTGLKDLGRLVDGQHRLASVLKSGVTLRFMVDWEVDPEAENFMDRGFKRDVGDEIANLTGAPKSVASAAAAIAKRVVAWDKGHPEFTSGDSNLTDQDQSDLVMSDLYYLEVASTVSRLQVPGASKSVLGTLYYLFARVDADDAHAFITALDEREDGYERTHPVQVARFRLQKLKNAQVNPGPGRKERVHQEDSARTIIRCWDAWRKGDEIKNWQTPKTFWKIV